MEWLSVGHASVSRRTNTTAMQILAWDLHLNITVAPQNIQTPRLAYYTVTAITVCIAFINNGRLWESLLPKLCFN